MSRRALSLPPEHGGALTVAGALVAAVLMSPRPLVALGAALVIGAAFFTRGPLEQLAVRGKPADYDRLALAGLVVVAGLAGAYAVVASGGRAAPTLAAAPAIVGLSFAARRRREHRSPAFELVAMAGLGASVGLMMLAGGAGLPSAAACAVVLGVHAAVAVPLVRSELRAGERARARSADRIALALVAGGAALLVGLGAERAPLAFLPRLLQLISRQFGRSQAARPAVVGLRETGSLAAAVALTVLARP